MSTPVESDSRVLTPGEDEPEVIVKAAFGGSGEAYHTTECTNVRKMRNTRVVKLSVAEWKGYHECHHCKQKKQKTPKVPPEPDTDTEDPTKERCKRVRELFKMGFNRNEVTEHVEWSRTAVYTHGTGQCTHEIDEKPVRHGWGYDESLPDTTSARDIDTASISKSECAELRRSLVEGDSLNSLGERFSISNDGVRYHAKGECGHEHPDLAPVSHGWHSV
jgi:hypothetical protein